MIYMEVIMVVSNLAFGIICAITDMNHGIVPNKLIIMGFATGFAIHLGLLLFGSAEYYPAWLVNMVIADAFAIGLYFAEMWGAGDAKLFMLLYFLLPTRLIDAGSMSYSITPYIFIFVPALLWTVSDSIYRAVKKSEYKNIPFSVRSFCISFLCIFVETTAFYCLGSVLFSNFIRQQGILVATLMLVYAYLCGTLRFMRKWHVVLIHMVIILVIWIGGKWELSFPFWGNYLIMAVTIIAQRFCSKYNYQMLSTASVKEGMILSTETILLFQKSRIQHLPGDPSENLTAKITKEEADAVRRWENSANGQKNIWIVRKVPFAIMIHIGFICWIVVRVFGG